MLRRSCVSYRSIIKHQRFNIVSQRELKTIHDIPGPGLPVVGHLTNLWFYLNKKNSASFHEKWVEKHKIYGPIYSEKIFGMTNIFVGSAKYMEEIFHRLGKVPAKPPQSIATWLLYRKLSGESNGLLTSEGDEWHRFRRTISPKMLKPNFVKDHLDDLNNVISDFIERMKHIKDKDGTIPQLPNEIKKWAMESICTVVFETRFGVLEDPMPPRSQEFINAVDNMLSATNTISFLTELHRRLNTSTWKTNYAAWDTIFEIAKYHIGEKMEELKRNPLEPNTDKKVGLLSYLLLDGKLSLKEIYGNVAEIFLGGVDTSSNTLAFTLYHLANNTNVQEKLFNEIDFILGKRIPTYEDLKNVPYLKMVIKESSRLTPVVPLYPRMLTEDANVGGYLIPKNTSIMLNNYAASIDDSIFDKPHDFIPDRWDRSSTMPHPFASLPFGMGTRVCIGRRLAELELHLSLCRIIQTFKLVSTTKYTITPRYRGVLTPGEEIPVVFQERV